MKSSGGSSARWRSNALPALGVLAGILLSACATAPSNGSGGQPMAAPPADTPGIANAGTAHASADQANAGTGNAGTGNASADKADAASANSDRGAAAPAADAARAPADDASSAKHTHSNENAGESGTSPACTCAAPAPRPKRKLKPKREPKQAPPQLPTAPSVVETPRGRVIDAKVAAMNVPVMSILGRRVQGPTGEDMGRVVDVLADDSGRVRVAIIDFGGFLGVGARRIAVDWPLLRFIPNGHDPALLLSLSVEKLRAAPEYKDNPRPQILEEPAAATAAPAADGKK